MKNPVLSAIVGTIAAIGGCAFLWTVGWGLERAGGIVYEGVDNIVDLAVTRLASGIVGTLGTAVVVLGVIILGKFLRSVTGHN